MTAESRPRPLWRCQARTGELLRLILGVVGVFVVRAVYGVAGALSAALSDGETFARRPRMGCWRSPTWPSATTGGLPDRSIAQGFRARLTISTTTHRARITRERGPAGARTLERLSVHDEVTQAQSP